MAPNEQTEGKQKRTSKDIIASAESVINKARAEKFQNEAKELLAKIDVAKASVSALEAELEAKAEAFDAG